MTPSDPELLERLDEDRTGESLRTLYRRYSDELYGFAYQALGDRGAADEVVQDVFTSVWRHAHTYDERRGSFRTWVYRIARNAVIDKRRPRGGRPRRAGLAQGPGGGPGGRCARGCRPSTSRRERNRGRWTSRSSRPLCAGRWPPRWRA